MCIRDRILQGTHLIQAGWILYGGTQWDVHSHENVQLVGALTVWHLFGVTLFMMVFFIVMKMILARLGKAERFSSLAVNESEAAAQERESLIASVEDYTSGTSQDSIKMHEFTESPA